MSCIAGEICECGKCCLCDIQDKEPSTFSRYSTTQDRVKCPKHKPTKMYCRIHYNGFYGHCQACLLESQAEHLLNMFKHFQWPIEPLPEPEDPESLATAETSEVVSYK